MAALGYSVTPLRTGAEKMIAHKTRMSQAVVAEANGTVTDIAEDTITVEYNGKPKYSKTYPLGKVYGKQGGLVFPHNVTTTLKKGSSFKGNDIVTFNSNYFEPDFFNPKQVNWKAGYLAKTVLQEGVDSWEDSAAISTSVSDALTAPTTKVVHIRAQFGQALHGLVKIGDKLSSDTILCTIEDELTASSDVFDAAAIETLRGIAAQTPKAGVKGVVDFIEVFYNGDFEDMSESVVAIVKASDRSRKKRAGGRTDVALTGAVTSNMRIEGQPIDLDTIVIRVYITYNSPAIGGDKGVVSNQLKCTFRRVLDGVNRSESGEDIEVVFGSESIDARIVRSAHIIGTTNVVLDLISKQAMQIIKEG